MVFYDWLARHFESDEQQMGRLRHGLIGEICADLWSQTFGMSTLPVGVYEEQLQQASERLKTRTDMHSTWPNHALLAPS